MLKSFQQSSAQAVRVITGQGYHVTGTLNITILQVHPYQCVWNKLAKTHY